MCFLYSYMTIPLRRLNTSVQSGLPVVLLEPFELRDHDVAGWEALLVFARTGARQEYLDKSRFRGRRLSRIPGGDNHEPANNFGIPEEVAVFPIGTGADSLAGVVGEPGDGAIGCVLSTPAQISSV